MVGRSGEWLTAVENGRYPRWSSGDTVAAKTETLLGTDSYTVSYSYLTSGERATATYVTPQSRRKWMYSDYVAVGEPTDAKRVFQTLNLSLAFGATGASWGGNLQVGDELAGAVGEDAAISLETIGEALGDFIGNAVGNAAGNAMFP